MKNVWGPLFGKIVYFQVRNHIFEMIGQMFSPRAVHFLQ